MALEDYTLKSIRDRLAEEFGIDATVTANADIIDKRINDALSWIVNRRKNWPWLELDTAIDVGELSTSETVTRYGVGLFSRMQRTVTNCVFSQTAIAAREFVDFDGKGHDGIMALAYAAPTLSLEHAYTGDPQICTVTAITATNPMVVTVTLTSAAGGTVVLPVNVTTFPVTLAGHTVTSGTDPDGTHVATRISNTTFSIPVDGTAGGGLVVSVFGTAQIGKEFTIAQSYFQLPIDFIRSDAVHIDVETDWNTVHFRNTTAFERTIRADRIVSNLNRIYTIIPDPIKSEDNKYIGIYPYFIDRNIIHVKYFRDTRKVVADADVPDVPRSDRFVVWLAAAWFVAQWQQSEMVSFYKDNALEELERMAAEYQLSDDVTEDIQMAIDGVPDIPQKGGFPEMDVD